MFPLSFLLLSLFVLFSRIFYPFSLSVLSFRSSFVSLIFSIVSFPYIISVLFVFAVFFFLVLFCPFCLLWSSLSPFRFPRCPFLSFVSVFSSVLFLSLPSSLFFCMSVLCHVVTVCPFCTSFLVFLSLCLSLLSSMFSVLSVFFLYSFGDCHFYLPLCYFLYAILFPLILFVGLSIFLCLLIYLSLFLSIYPAFSL